MFSMSNLFSPSIPVDITVYDIQNCIEIKDWLCYYKSLKIDDDACLQRL